MRAERPLRRIEQLVPALLRWRHLERSGNKLVPRIQVVSALRSNRPGEHVQQQEGARRLPPSQVAGRGATPQVRGKATSGSGDLACELDHSFCFDSAFFLRELGSKAGVVFLQGLDDSLERLTLGAESIGFQFFPIRPSPNEGGIEAVLIENHFGHGQKDRCLSAGISRQPVVGHASRVRKPGIHNG